MSGIRANTLKQTKPEFPLWQPFTTSSRPVVAGAHDGWFAAWALECPATQGQDIHGRAVWDLFCDGFEDHMSTWSAHVP